MQKKVDAHIFAGMQKDMAISKHKNEFLYDAYNIRFTPMEGNTMMSITNERGPKYQLTCNGKYVGHCVIDKYLVVFTKSADQSSLTPDRIVRYEPNNDNDYNETVLYEGNLNFSTEYTHQLETLGVYENENIIKVYWVDGLNQPRVINIKKTAQELEDRKSPYAIDTQFDFIETLALNESVTITRNNTGGMFEEGIIQYAFSYYYLNGQETNIWYTTPINYISFYDRGASPEEKVGCSFSIRVEDIESRFDYLRIYSIHKTSKESINVRIVKDVSLVNSNGTRLTTVDVLDDGVIGETFDYSRLSYVGGNSITAETLTTKSSTLFLGNIGLNRLPLSNIDLSDLNITTTMETATVDSDSDVYYSYIPMMQKVNPYFKIGENYLFGVQFQHKTGKWSDPIVVGSGAITVSSSEEVSFNSNTGVLTYPVPELLIPSSKINSSLNDYVNVRGVCVFPNVAQRKILTQGVLCPTVFNYNFREKNAPFTQASWIFRPRVSNSLNDIDFNTGYQQDMSLGKTGSIAEFRHNHYLPSERGAGTRLFNIEIDGEVHPKENDLNEKVFGVDESIITLNSPDVDFDTNYYNLPLSEMSLTLDISKIALIEGTQSVVDIETSTSSDTGESRANNKLVTPNGKFTISDFLWKSKRTLDDGIKYNVEYLIHPWQGDGTLGYAKELERTTESLADSSESNSEDYDNGQIPNLLKRKTTVYYRFSKDILTLNPKINYGIADISIHQYINEDLSKLTTYESSQKATYLGNVDTVVQGGSSGYYRISDYVNNEVTDGPPDPNSSQPNGRRHSPSTSVKETTARQLRRDAAPVRIGYKSGNHIVLALDSTKKILPGFGNFEDTTVNNIWQDSIVISGTDIKKIDFLAEPPEDGYTEVILWRDENGNFNTFKGYTSDGGQTYVPYNTLNGVYLNPSDNKLYEVVCEHDHFIDGGIKERYVIHTSLILPVPYSYYYYLNNSQVYTVYKVKSDYTLEVTSDYSVPSDYSSSNTISRPTFTVDNRYSSLVSNGIPFPYLFIGELKNSNPIGISAEDSLWLPAGEPVKINNQGTIVKYTYGDTWYQRYDCLKTLPYTEEHSNSIIDIFSFMCETRVNIDGRHDKKRGTADITINNTNFNKINEVYSSKNDVFKYRILPDYMYKTSRFSNQLLFTQDKFSGSEIDYWTSLDLASTFDMDGTKGEITSLKTFNDNIICFQDNAISHILFDTRVQIPTSDGIPIEISNSKKLDGKRIISDSIGCSNKWSIKNTPNALYFLDSNSKKLYAFTDKLQTISDTHGFDHHFKSIEHFDSEKTFYDPIRQDLYLVWDNQCLIWSELLGQFTSFMSYEGVPAMFSIGDTFYCLHYHNMWEDGQYVQKDGLVLLYKMFAGSYNRFFGDLYKPVRLAFVSNPDGSTDKIFSTLGARLDIFQEPINANGTWNTNIEPNSAEQYLFNPKYLEYDAFFDYIRATNEYQDTGEVMLPQSWFAPASHGFNKDYNPKKKFRMWRVDIPRDKDRKLDRIRNTWAKIELGFIPPVISSNSPSNQTLLDYASSHGITDFSIDLYREGLYEESGLAEYYTGYHPRSTPSSLTDAQKQYYRKHLVLHDLDVQYFV